MDDWTETSPTEAVKERCRAALPLLLGRLEALSDRMALDSARARLLAVELRQCLVPLSGGSISTTGPDDTTVEVRLPPTQAASTEAVIESMMRRFPGMTTDDCVVDIFEAGLASMTEQFVR